MVCNMGWDARPRGHLLGCTPLACKSCSCPGLRSKKEPRDSNRGINGLLSAFYFVHAPNVLRWAAVLLTDKSCYLMSALLIMKWYFGLSCLTLLPYFLICSELGQRRGITLLNWTSSTTGSVIKSHKVKNWHSVGDI